MALNLNPKPTPLLLLIRDPKRTLPAANAFPSGKRMVVQAKLRGAPRLEVRGRRHDVGFLTYCFSIITSDRKPRGLRPRDLRAVAVPLNPKPQTYPPTTTRVELRFSIS